MLRDPSYYTDDSFTADALAVLDALDMTSAAVPSASMGASWNLLLTVRLGSCLTCNYAEGRVLEGRPQSERLRGAHRRELR